MQLSTRSFPVLLVEEMMTGVLANKTVGQLRRPALKEGNEREWKGRSRGEEMEWRVNGMNKRRGMGKAVGGGGEKEGGGKSAKCLCKT